MKPTEIGNHRVETTHIPIERGYLPSVENAQPLTTTQNKHLAEKRFGYWLNHPRYGVDQKVTDMAMFWHSMLDQPTYPEFVQDDYDFFDLKLNYADMHIIKMFGNIDNYKSWMHPKSIIGTVEDIDDDKIACMAYSALDVDKITADWKQRGYFNIASSKMHSFFGAPTNLWYLVMASRY